MTVELDRIGVDGLDLALAGELAEIDNAALEQTVRRRHTAETFLYECRDYGTEGPLEGIWLARLDGRVVGYAGLTLNLYENRDGAKILGAVHPDHQRRGTGRALMEAAEAGTDRPRLRAPAWSGTAGEQAVPRLGYTRQGSHEVRRLSLREAPSAALVAEAERSAAAYDLERIVGGCPDHLLPEMQVLREAINDAPEGGEFEAYPPERIRSVERWLAGQRQTPYTIVARHRATGEAAGLTITCTHDLRPAIAAQEDTSVLPAHRGHRLGLRMKLAMLAWLRDERPEVEFVDTWNAAGNAPMIAINDALGCWVVAETIAFRKDRSASA
ncbi:GNAT family N-acetyltransferase [Nocardioides cynanchi]|uniref:GNAT family N-acetyltransferase n=1 Tax=Nocardioides cynanchi TaxID=2558918 RepID=UPI0012474D2F|nr:GNAT family N-acetyltransferase [Nocardioides cynanchi]